MRILDQNNNTVLEVDNTKGYLKSERMLVKHHDAVEAVKARGHYEVVKEYPNGGKEVAWIVDVPGVAASEAWDEYEDILRFIPYTDLELAQIRIVELKEQLQKTDYMILKVVEGAATLAEIAETVTKRALWRAEINQLERKFKLGGEF